MGDVAVPERRAHRLIAAPVVGISLQVACLDRREPGEMLVRDQSRCAGVVEIVEHGGAVMGLSRDAEGDAVRACSLFQSRLPMMIRLSLAARIGEIACGFSEVHDGTQ